ncbi:MAG: hypothetical protein GY858_05180, partial [Candidatus Omnitrophica bacterium]|nr:hypothetical protein [Candidatus Omnitrophota bacterium]
MDLKPSEIFTTKKPQILINDGIREALASSLKDMVIFAKWADTDRCTIFEQIAPELLGKSYVLREIDSYGYPDFSLSRCAEKIEAKIAVFP